MAKLTEEAKKAIGTMRRRMWATASKTGKPNVSAKGSLRVMDDEHVLFSVLLPAHRYKYQRKSAGGNPLSGCGHA